jgi:hypothetical protein
MTPSKSANAGSPRLERGIYCLANDEALEWFQAFVRSLRQHSPKLPLTVIPYNASISRLLALQSQFDFTVMAEPECTRFDAIAHRVAGQRIAGGTFRKLCCFFGRYDTFLFLDSDIVVTQPLEPFFAAFEKASTDFVYFDSSITVVYTPDFLREMQAKYNSPCFNSGAFIARRGCFSEMEILDAVESGEKIRDHFAIWGEQPFLNYLVDITRRRTSPAGRLVPGITDKPWAGEKFHHDDARDVYVDAQGLQMPFIHWAGCEWPTMFHPEIFLRYRTLGMTRAERMNYVLNFYYRRFRAQMKERMKTSGLFSGWVARREERLRQKKSPASAKPE